MKSDCKPQPSTALGLWLLAMLAIQFLDYPGLAILCLVVVREPGVMRPWLAHVRRARWLFLSLWLVLAYNTPGEAYADLAWAPTYEGVADASLQAGRLLVMLACLAWLFVRLGRAGLVSGLWSVLQPLQRMGLDCSRLVVRLSLVMENLQTPPPPGAWRTMLASGPEIQAGPDILHISVTSRGSADFRLLFAGLAVLAVALLL